MRRIAVLLVGLITAAALGWASERPQAGRDPDNPERPKVKADDNKVERLMRRKLEHAKGLLEGLALADHNRLVREGRGLLLVSQQAEWQVIASPRYMLHSNELQRAVNKLIKSARAKDTDAAALAYVDMTLTCVRCHEYVREVRSADLGGKPDPAVALSLAAPTPAPGAQRAGGR
jgi:hypothetical protein